MDKRIEKLRELMNNEAFVKELFAKKTPEEAQATFESKGADITIEEVKALGGMLAKAAKGDLSAEDIKTAASGELSEAELEEAAGGVAGIVTAALVLGGTFIVTGGVAAGATAAVKYADEIGDWFASW